MTRNSLLLIFMLVSALLYIPQVSSAVGFEIGAGYWGQGPSGDLAYKPLSSSDRLDLDEDLNYDTEYKPFGRVKIDLPLLFLPDLYLIVTPMKYDEEGSKTESFKFGDKIFDATVPFETKVQMNLYDICLYYSLPFINTATLGTLNAEIGLNTRIVDFEAEVTGREEGSVTEFTETESRTIPVPMLYAGIQINPIDFLSIEAEIRGIAYSSDHYFDAIGRIKLKAVDTLFIAGGYRHNDIQIDYSDVDVSMKFSGPFIEAGVHF